MNELRRRIRELDRKSAQLLIFLAIGIAAAVLLWSADLLTVGQQDILLRSMRWWLLAILPAAVTMLPLKEFRENSLGWYGAIRYLKFVLLWLAIAFIVVGTTYFIRAMISAEPVDDTESTRLHFHYKTEPRDSAWRREFSAINLASSQDPPRGGLCQG